MNSSVKETPGSLADELVILRMEAVERMGDEEIYREIAHYFAEHLQGSLDALGTALNGGDLADAARLAHSLKGNCATVGAEAMRGHCLTLERSCRAGDLQGARAGYALTAPKMLALRDLLLSS